jgi:integrase
MYEVPLKNKTESEAEALRIKASLALQDIDPWPEELESTKQVKKYLCHIGEREDDAKAKEGQEAVIPDNILDIYNEHQQANVSKTWANDSLGRLKKLKDKYSSFPNITTRQAGKSIDGIMIDKSVATSNRYLATYTKFYKWLIRNYNYSENPFEGIKQKDESHNNDDIVYATKNERDEILRIADSHRLGIAIWIAFLAGCRRGEVFRIKPSNINWDNESMVVHATKTGKTRTVPLSSKLVQRLKEELKKEGRPTVRTIVPNTNKDYSTAARRLLESLEKKIRKDKLILEKEKATEGYIDRLCELLKFNVFRHTFCTQAIMAGVPLDTVAMWAGHSPEICKRHYARFVPKDKKDNRIDLMD